MPLPQGFNPVEHLQDTIRIVTNRSVREWFKDLGGENWDADIGTQRGSLRVACTHRDDDSIDTTLLRLLLFSHEVGEAKSLQAPVFAMPTSDTPARRGGRPKLTLFFKQGYRDPSDPGGRKEGVISFRIMDETSESLTNSKLVSIGNRIKTLFGAGNGFVWHKGRKMCSYSDWSKGYQLQLLCRDKAEGRRVVEQVLDIQQHTPNWEYFNMVETEDELGKYPTNPGSKVLLGKSRRLKAQRPIVDVRFQYAHIALEELPHPILVYDRTGFYPNPIVSA